MPREVNQPPGASASGGSSAIQIRQLQGQALEITGRLVDLRLTRSLPSFALSANFSDMRQAGIVSVDLAQLADQVERHIGPRQQIRGDMRITLDPDSNRVLVEATARNPSRRSFGCFGPPRLERNTQEFSLSDFVRNHNETRQSSAPQELHEQEIPNMLTGTDDGASYIPGPGTAERTLGERLSTRSDLDISVDSFRAASDSSQRLEASEPLEDFHVTNNAVFQGVDMDDSGEIPPSLHSVSDDVAPDVSAPAEPAAALGPERLFRLIENEVMAGWELSRQTLNEVIDTYREGHHLVSSGQNTREEVAEAFARIVDEHAANGTLSLTSGEALRQYGQPQSGFIRIQTKPGQESYDIAKALRQNPTKKINVIYQGQPGVDAGGLRRQALNSAYQQLTHNTRGLVVDDGSSLKPMNQKSVEHACQEYRDLGLVLGAISHDSFTVGRGVSPEFFTKIAPVFQFLQEHPELTFDKRPAEVLPLLVSSLNDEHFVALDESQQKDLVVQLLFKLQPVLASGKEADYIRSEMTDLEDVKGYLDDLEPTLEFLAGFLQTMNPEWKSVDVSAKALEASICGESDLKEELLNITIKSEHSKTDVLSSIAADAQVQIFSNWFKGAVREATPQQLESFCQNITGASGLPVAGGKSLKVFLHPNASMNGRISSAHTCFNYMDVDFDLFSEALSAGNKEGLVEAFFSDSGSFDIE